jgi:hypothetical protein
MTDPQRATASLALVLLFALSLLGTKQRKIAEGDADGGAPGRTQEAGPVPTAGPTTPPQLPSTQGWIKLRVPNQRAELDAPPGTVVPPVSAGAPAGGWALKMANGRTWFLEEQENGAAVTLKIIDAAHQRRGDNPLQRDATGALFSASNGNVVGLVCGAVATHTYCIDVAESLSYDAQGHLMRGKPPTMAECLEAWAIARSVRRGT